MGSRPYYGEPSGTAGPQLGYIGFGSVRRDTLALRGKNTCLKYERSEVTFLDKHH